MLKTSIDYATASARDLARALAERELSAVELLDAAVARIEAQDPAVNAVVVKDFDRARTAAMAADAALARGEQGPLLGVPMTVKECFDVEGLPTTWGFANHADWRPRRTATAVQRLKGAGAVILGKTNVPPALGDWQSANPVYGRTSNPHDLGRSPGGSSGGSAAALASGMVPLELGTDIGGSIRVPAHFCGVYGHKATFGIIPQTGKQRPGSLEPAAPSEFSVAGPMARSAADLDLALQILAGPDGEMAEGYRLTLPPSRIDRLEGCRVLVIDEHPSCATDPEIARAIRDLADRLSDAGAEVSDRSELLPDLAEAQRTYSAMMLSSVTRGAPNGVRLSAWDWMDGLDLAAAHKSRWASLFRQFDVVLAPPFGTAAFPHMDDPDWSRRSLLIGGRPTPYGEQTAWPGLATFPGLPATCAPIARTAAGLPIGVQIMGPWLGDRTTIAFAGLIEELQAP